MIQPDGHGQPPLPAGHGQPPLPAGNRSTAASEKLTGSDRLIRGGSRVTGRVGERNPGVTGVLEAPDEGKGVSRIIEFYDPWVC